MVVRREKKNRKQRGSKSHGWGSKKKHRGGGSQGGKGQSGMMKHKKSWRIKYDPEHFGKVGFNIPYSRKIKAISLKEIDIFAKRHNKREINVSELGYDKVLGSGRLTQPLIIKASMFVEKAKQKIEKAGGKHIEG